MLTRAVQTLIATSPVLAPAERTSFDLLYRRHFDFVWRSLRRLGVPEAQVEDAAQDAFIVVHRRLGDLRPDASVKAFLFGIALRVANGYRRTLRRKGTTSLDLGTVVATSGSPFEQTAKVQAERVLEQFLATLDQDRRAVFVMAELEEMTAPEISEALDVNLSTVYTRLRAARQRFVAYVGAASEPKAAP